jgi:hypothetical protein
MNHDWIFEILRDLRLYAESNGFTSLADKATETLRVAELEIRRGREPKGDDNPGGEGGRIH